MVTAELTFLIPEIVLFTLACIILVVDTFGSPEDKSFTYWLSQSSLIVAAALLFYLFPDTTEYVMSMNFVSDQMGSILKIFICVLTSVVFFYSYDYLKEHELVKGEYFVLGLFAVLGMMVMVSAYSLLTIYLGLELLSLSLYAMVAMHRDSQTASEAAMKYFVLGALASGMLLYGISMLYGVSGAIDLASLSTYISQQNDTGVLLTFGLVFVIVGIAFKLGAVPFHMWVPDVYQGSPSSVTLFISSAPKIAAFAMAIRLLVDGMEGLLENWQGMLMILSVLSMAAGNIIAISQTNIKRMLAYSTIAHVGFLLLGIASGSHEGYAGSMFYVLTYALMSMGAFGMIILLGRRGYEADSIEDFKGLATRSPWFAFMMLILMFSMAGVPPLVGFWAKWFVIKEIVAMGYIWLAAVAVLFSVIGAYYYLRIVKLMYFDKPEQMTAIKASQGMRFILSVNGLTLLILGFVPGLMMSLCLKAFAF
jgi:NADH-quinone oxidoreductase subunit N